MSTFMKLLPVGAEVFHASLVEFWRKENFLSLTWFEPRTIQPLANCYTD